MERAKHIEKKFPPTKAGDRVGWVRVHKIEDSEYTAIDVVTSTIVGENGAESGYTSWVGDGEEEADAPRSPYQKGFGQTAAFSALLSSEQKRDEEFNLAYVPEGMQYPMHGYTPKSDDLLMNGTGETRHRTDGVEKLWVQNSTELLGTLRHSLGSVGLESAYPTMYYWMNRAIGSEYPAQSALQRVDPASLLLVDASMQEQTHEQLRHMLRMQEALSENITNDENMKNRLTGFIVDTPMMELRGLFEDSRTRAAASEQKVREAANELLVRRIAYVPTGHGRSGRTWPFMDAGETDVDKAYGNELQALRSRDTSPAVHELNREIRELTARRILAAESIQRFRLLNKLERSA